MMIQLLLEQNLLLDGRSLPTIAFSLSSFELFKKLFEHVGIYLDWLLILLHPLLQSRLKLVVSLQQAQDGKLLRHVVVLLLGISRLLVVTVAAARRVIIVD